MAADFSTIGHNRAHQTASGGRPADTTNRVLATCPVEPCDITLAPSKVSLHNSGLI
jgi:hypothetical protein